MKEEISPKQPTAASAFQDAASKDSSPTSIDAEILEKYHLMQKFISETYVKGIYCHLINKELSLSMESPVQPEAAERDLITAKMNPFTSTAVENLAKLFDLEDEANER